MPAIRQLRRLPFSRADIVVSRTVEHGECPNCGRDGNLYKYGIWHDGGRLGFQDKSFCSSSCCQDYYGPWPKG